MPAAEEIVASTSGDVDEDERSLEWRMKTDDMLEIMEMILDRIEQLIESNLSNLLQKFRAHFFINISAYSMHITIFLLKNVYKFEKTFLLL
jgi:hypothetical protein